MYATLEQLLDSHTRAKLLKLFYRNTENNYLFSEIVEKTQSKPKDVKAELRRLENMKLVAKRKHKGRLSYCVDKDARYYATIEKLVAGMGTIPLEYLVKMIEKLGDVKLALVSGIFLDLPYAKADLLVVGEGISKVKLSNFLKKVEADTGKEIDYALMDIEEYSYRKEMFDRFLLDLSEKPHKILIDKFKPKKNLKK